MKTLALAAFVFAASAALAVLVNRYQRPRFEYRRQSEREWQRAMVWREN